MSFVRVRARCPASQIDDNNVICRRDWLVSNDLAMNNRVDIAKIQAHLDVRTGIAAHGQCRCATPMLRTGAAAAPWAA